MEIKNITNAAVRVPLLAGKRLFLSPGGKAKITHKNAEHAPVKALIDAGTLEIIEIGRPNKSGTSGSGLGPSESHSGGGQRHTGDR